MTASQNDVYEQMCHIMILLHDCSLTKDKSNKSRMFCHFFLKNIVFLVNGKLKIHVVMNLMLLLQKFTVTWQHQLNFTRQPFSLMNNPTRLLGKKASSHTPGQGYVRHNFVRHSL
jgi:hypothetical protein